MPERPRVVRSSSNPGVKRVVKLRSARARRDTGLFPVEGFREVRRALHAGIDFEQLWFCEDLFLGAHERGLLDAAEARGIDTVACEPGPFSKMAYRDRPEGLIGVCRMFDTSLDRLTPGPGRCCSSSRPSRNPATSGR